MMFGLFFDTLMTSAKKRCESKKSQSLGSESMCHSTLKVHTGDFFVWMSPGISLGVGLGIGFISVFSLGGLAPSP